MRRMVVKNKALHYGGRSMKAGDVFEATDVDAKYFKNREKADDAPAEQPKPARVPRSQETPAPVAEPVANAESATELTTQTAGSGLVAGRYGRRDLRSED